jgi:pSer/pThr/pTyr-binding forkhead associated (FHA) protein
MLPPMAQLVVVSGPLEGKTFAIDPGLTIGRESHNTIAMPENKKCSRDHAKVWREGPNAYAVADLGSTNGTLVNDEKVSRQPLKDGDVIAIGETALRFELGEDEKPKAKAAPPKATLAEVLSGKAPLAGQSAAGAPGEGPKIEVKSRLLQYSKKEGGRGGLKTDVSQTAGLQRWILVGIALGVAAGLYFAVTNLF